MTKVLVVAASGALGSRVATAAVAAGHAVAVLVRSAEKLEAALTPATLAALEQVHVGDATDAAALQRALEGREVVVECMSTNGAECEAAAKFMRQVRASDGYGTYSQIIKRQARGEQAHALDSSSSQRDANWPMSIRSRAQLHAHD